MRNFRERFMHFMYGRYGNDDLYRFSLIVALVLLVTMVIVRLCPEGLAQTVTGAVLSVALILLYAWTIFRSMSRNIAKRRRENEIYLKAVSTVKRGLTRNTSGGTRSRNRDDSVYIFRDCTRCGATLRLPRNPGRHPVRCPRCAHGFYVKSR